jgi:DUF4097 and DUF4098 domain-containing protein YvlB
MPEGPLMKIAALVVFAFVAFVVWAGGPASFAADGHNLSTVNGAVRAEPGVTYGNLSAVNGDVRVGRGASADHAKTVNGEIVVEEDAKLGEVETVNGSLDIRDGVTVARTASTVNGSVELGRRTHVGGDVSTVSGEIELNGAEVTGKLVTTNGDIELRDGARVLGGIHVRKNNGWSWSKDDPIKVHVCSTCVVEGDLRFDRPVELRVDQGGKVGQVIGESVKRL